MTLPQFFTAWVLLAAIAIGGGYLGLDHLDWHFAHQDLVHQEDFGGAYRIANGADQ